jgi:hypothetical protein
LPVRLRLFSALNEERLGCKHNGRGGRICESRVKTSKQL